MLSDTQQRALSQVVFFENLQTPVSHEPALVLHELPGVSAGELAGVGEIDVGSDKKPGVPEREESIEVARVPLLDADPRQLQGAPWHT